MKLLLCLKCNDIFSLDFFEKSCSCGSTKGKYLDQKFAEYCGEFAVPLGISNPSLINAIKNQPHEGMGELINAFIIPKNCPTFFRK